MIRLLASGANASLVAKSGTKINLKIVFLQTLQILIGILRYLEAEIDYRSFILFLEWCSKIMQQKFQVILTQIKGVDR